MGTPTWEKGSTSAGNYIRVHDGGTDLFVLMNGKTTGSGGNSSETITLPYTGLDNATYFVDASAESTADDQCAHVSNKTTTTMVLANWDGVNSGAFRRGNPMYWNLVWIKSGTNTYDDFICGDSSGNYYIRFQESSSDVRVLMVGNDSGATYQRTFAMPVTLANTNYYAHGTSNNTSSPREIARDPGTCTTSSVSFEQRNRAGVQTGTYDWIVDWISV